MSQIEQLDDSFLDNEQVAEPVVEITESEPVETEEVEAPVVEATEVEVEEVETKPVVETTATEEESWTKAQAMDERRKRQEWERKAQELEEKLQKLENPEPTVSVFDDEEAKFKQVDNSIDTKLRNTALNMSQAFAEEVFGEEKVAAATEWMQTEGIKSPHAVEEFNNAKLPYHAAVKMYEAEQDRLNPDALRAKLKAEILAELKTEVKEPDEPITPSLASSRSAGDVNEAPESFEDLLKE